MNQNDKKKERKPKETHAPTHTLESRLRREAGRLLGREVGRGLQTDVVAALERRGHGDDEGRVEVGEGAGAVGLDGDELRGHVEEELASRGAEVAEGVEDEGHEEEAAALGDSVVLRDLRLGASVGRAAGAVPHVGRGGGVDDGDVERPLARAREDDEVEAVVALEGSTSTVAPAWASRSASTCLTWSWRLVTVRMSCEQLREWWFASTAVTATVHGHTNEESGQPARKHTADRNSSSRMACEPCDGTHSQLLASVPRWLASRARNAW